MSHRGEAPAVVGGQEIMLFGVRVIVDPMRKSVSMNNLSEYEPLVSSGGKTKEMPKDLAVEAGYASADDAVPLQSGGNRERKRGVPWTVEEHKLFLLGLEKVGRGDWRGISRNYVKSRTPTQVASHAQKYFLRRSNNNRRRRRSSLLDITTASVSAMPIEEANISSGNGFSVVQFPVSIAPNLFSMQSGNSLENSATAQTERANFSSPILIRPIHVPTQPCTSTIVDLNLRQQVAVEPLPLSLRLSLSSGQDQPSTQASAFQMMQQLKNGDSIISVA